jgi:hypothetical protein
VDQTIREWFNPFANMYIRGWFELFANGSAHSRMGYVRGWVGTYIISKLIVVFIYIIYNFTISLY